MNGNRYHLYISLACPWACRCAAALALKGLEDVIGMTVTHPVWQRTRPDDPQDIHAGWTFVSESHPQPFTPPYGQGSFHVDPASVQPNALNAAQNVRELYDLSQVETTKYTVPILWDTHTNVIVNNESADILRILNREFNTFAKFPQLDLYPPALAPAIDEVNAVIYAAVNNGVYLCGFAKTQAAYDTAIERLFATLDDLETRLGKQRYLCGQSFTEADLRLFVTLIRFDEVYVVHFKTNRKTIREYPNLFSYVRDIYQLEGMAKTVNMEHIKKHYFACHAELNKFCIVPAGPGVDYTQAHDRASRKYSATQDH